MTAAGDRSIATDSNTKVFLVTAGSSSPINVSDLGGGQQAEKAGQEQAGCEVRSADQHLVTDFSEQHIG